VDSVLFGELWILRRAYWPEDTIEHYAKVVKKANCIFVLFRDTSDGSLRGCYTAEVLDGEIEGKKYRALYLGSTFMYTYYRGKITLATTMFLSFTKHWWNTPSGMKTYIVFGAITYKAYLVACHTYPNMYPTYNNYDSFKCKDYKNVIRDVMQRLYPAYWDDESFAVHLPGTEFDIAPIQEQYLNDPDIRFFMERNPNFEKGVAMPCAFVFNLFSVLHTIVTVALRTGIIANKTGKKLNPQKRDRVPITQRDLARTYVHPPETNLGRTFNLKDYKEKKSKKKLRNFVSNFKKSYDIVEMAKNAEEAIKEVKMEDMQVIEQVKPTTDFLRSSSNHVN